MPTIASPAPKAKITLTLSKDLVQQIDELVKSPRARSRSQLVEDAIRRWLHEHAREELERQTEAYYLSLSEAEREEDREWTETAAQAAGPLWEK
jgi:metal-responsive CopG/Arc/MetJ family transcriptional regulator